MLPDFEQDSTSSQEAAFPSLVPEQVLVLSEPYTLSSEPYSTLEPIEECKEGSLSGESADCQTISDIPKVKIINLLNSFLFLMSLCLD